MAFSAITTDHISDVVQDMIKIPIVYNPPLELLEINKLTIKMEFVEKLCLLYHQDHSNISTQKLRNEERLERNHIRYGLLRGNLS